MCHVCIVILIGKYTKPQRQHELLAASSQYPDPQLTHSLTLASSLLCSSFFFFFFNITIFYSLKQEDIKR